MEIEKQHGALACERYEPLLADYLAGECTGADAAKVEAHLSGCLNCRSAMEEARTGSEFLVAALPLLEQRPEPRPEFARTTMARIRMEAQNAAARLGFWQPFVAFAWRFAATAMLALVILLTYAVRMRHLGVRPTSVIGQAPLADVFAPDPTRVPASQDEILLMVAETDHTNANH